MAQYTKQQLISASNATYFTNVNGGISASAVRDLNDSWVSSSALLSGSNTFIGNQIISGTMTAQLPANYIWLGDSNGYNQAVATSSISLQGAQGIQGLQGTQGTQGIQGIQGLQGLQGIQGLEGLQGIQGVSGSQGTQGIQGLQGLQGIQGADNSTQGTQGVQGFTGAQGIQGITGITGSNGTQGAQGIQGVQGTQGDNVSSGSLLVTASFASTNITFTKGDATTFDLPGFATTGSNTFVGDQFINANATISASKQLNFGDNGNIREADFNIIAFDTNAGNYIRNFLSGEMYLEQNAADELFVYNRGGFPVFISGSYTDIQGLRYPTTDGTNGQAIITNGSGILSFGNVSINTGSLLVTGSVAGNVLTFTKGDATTFNLTVATGSGGGGTGSVDTGSLLVTASFASTNITFTKGDASQFSLQGFATTGSNTFTGQQSFITTASPAITISGSGGFGYGIELTGGSGLKITGPGGPRLQFPNEMWLNGNENDDMQFTGDTDNPKSRGLDFFLYGTGSRQMQFRNNSGTSATMKFQTTTATGGNSIQMESVSGGIYINAGSGIQITGSTLQMQGFTYPTTDGTNGQVLTTNGSKTLTFTTVASSIDTGSFLTTGSINTSQNVLGAINFYPTGSTSGYAIQIFNTGSDASGSMRLGVTDPGNPFIQLKGQPWFQFGTGNQLQFQSFTSSYDNGIIIGPYYTSSEKVHLMPRSSSLQFSQDIGSGEVPIFTLGTYNGVSQSIFEKDLRVKGQFTASLQQGYAWVGNASGISTLVATSSFGGGGGGDTGSLLVTASFDNTTRDITFTKGDNTTFKLGGFATTGSNTFYGNQNISGSSGGANFNINAAGASNGTVSIGQTGAGNLQFLQSGSIIIRTTAIGSIDHNWTSSFYNDINVVNNSRIILTGNATPSSGQGEVYLLSRSGSLVLSNSTATATAAGVSNITSSQINGNTSLMFKTIGNSTGSLLLNGPGNIFTVPTAPANLTYQKYIGGSNNIYLNNQGGVATLLTSSAASVSGNKPTMHNNIFAGTSNFTINLPNNPGSNNYNSNIDNGQTTINAMGFTGSLTLSNNINNNGSITINPASASFNEITGGFSGSHAINVAGNGLFGGVITQTTNRNQAPNITNNITSNVIAGGQISITNHSSSVAVNAQNNITNATINYSNAGAANLALHRNTATISQNYGPLTLIASASAISATGNIGSSALTVTNRMYSGSLGSGSVGFNNNQVQGAGNTYQVSGSYNGTAAGTLFAQNCIFGGFNTFFTNVEGRGNYTSISANGVFGANLILTGSNNTVLSENGGAHIGRWNANDGIRNTTGENIFSVGTGVSGARKTGFLIDSGSNSYFEGTLNVSGSTAMTGSLIVSSFTTLASVSSSLNFADDTAAAAGGVPLGGLYRNGNFVMIRLT
jgi:hypothetical protein